MSIIQTIRNRYAKVAGFVIALALVGFILMDASSGSFGDWLKGKDQTIAKVNGAGIDQKEYEQRQRDYESLYKVFSKGQPINDEVRTQLRQQTISELITESLIKKDADKLGLTVSDAEIKDMIYGADPDQTIQQFPYFINQKSGQFDPRGIKQFEGDVKKDGGRTPQIAEAGEQWTALKAYVVRNRLIQKYTALVSGAVSTPAFLQSRNDRDAAQMAGIRYVKIPATAIPDSEVPVTDADINAFMDKHAAMFKVAEPGRNIDYVVFDVKPNAQDTARARGELEKMYSAFSTSTDVENYVNSNSDTSYAGRFVSRKSFMSPYANDIMNLPVGGVYGPYYEGGAYKLTKVTEIKQMPDSVRAQHILIATASQQNPDGLTDTLAHAKADSLLTAIRAGASFDTLAKNFSVDGSKDKGGDLGYFTYGTMVPEFNSMVFDGKTGDMKVVKTQFGYHVIRITDQKNFLPFSNLATVTKLLNISDQAEQSAYAKANEFAARNNTAALFDAAAGKNGINKMTAQAVKPYDFALNGTNGAREIIRWAYDAKVGAVSNPIHIGERYIVAKVAGDQEKGRMAITPAIRPQIEAAVKAEKKLDKIAARYKGQASLDALAASAAQPVMTADSFFANASMINGLGYEPKIVGYAFSQKLQPGAMSPAIKGRDAVYYITVTHRGAIARQDNPMEKQQQRQMADMQLRQALSSTLLEGLKKRADVTYSAKNIY